MKDLKALVWLTQLGVSVAMPPLMFIWGAVWLRARYELGVWVLILGIVLGLVGAIDGLRYSLKALTLSVKDKKDDKPPPVAFNDHD